MELLRACNNWKRAVLEAGIIAANFKAASVMEKGHNHHKELREAFVVLRGTFSARLIAIESFL